MKKCWCTWVMIVVFCAIVSSCAGSRAPTKDILKMDLSNHETFSIYADMLDISISDFEIIKRQTTAEDKIDQAWVRVNVSGPQVKGEMYYLMAYELYNDGWRLETIQETDLDQWRLTPLTGVDEDTITSHLPAGANIESNETDLETGSQVVVYTYKESFPNCDIIYRRELRWGFGSGYHGTGTGGFGMWNVQNDVEAGTVENWAIDGTWKVSKTWGLSEVVTYTLTINDFSPGGVAYDQNEDNDVFNAKGTLTYHSDVSALDDSFHEYHITRDFLNEDGALEVKAVQHSDGEVTYRLYARGYEEKYNPRLFESEQHMKQAREFTVEVTRNKIVIMQGGVSEWVMER